MEALDLHTKPATEKLLSASIKFDLGGETGITIDSFTNSEGKTIYRLSWTDYVANECNEFYATLSLALARLAVLTACIEQSTEEDVTILKNTSESFAFHAYQFINNQVN